MNKLYRSIAAAVTMLLLFLTGCTFLPSPETDHIDGGVVHHTDGDAPKEIVSGEITYFRCYFSMLTVMEEDSPIAGRMYLLEAVRDGSKVKGRYCSDIPSEESSDLSFETEPEFMDSLQDIVARYDFAQHNGYYHHVSGLPGHFGVELDIQYDSGEYISASDNQDLFLPFEGLEELESLFREFFQQN